jgi:CheY-like chemotaxis protein
MYRILIVDDHHEVRRVLRSAVESLGPEYQVIDIPSAEEAMLVHSREKIDLLVADIRLPGISGMELMDKIHRRNPDAKVILITGLEDQQIRQQVARSGASAAFFKPIAINDFLSAVQTALGEADRVGEDPSDALTGPSSAAEFPGFDQTQTAAGVPGRLASLKAEASASAAAIIDGRGEIVEISGDLPEDFPSLHRTIGTLIQTSGQLKTKVDKEPIEGLLRFDSTRWTLLLTHIRADLGLILFTRPGQEPGAAGNYLFDASRDLENLLSEQDLAAKDQPDAPGMNQDQVQTEIEEEISEDDLKQVEAIFQKSSNVNPEGGNLSKLARQYWDGLVADGDLTNSLKDGSLSYDEARQMGLAPEDE